jgi:3-deoxy-D-manno-octulosonic-acid transferase
MSPAPDGPPTRRAGTPAARRGGESAFSYVVHDLGLLLGLAILAPILLTKLVLHGKYRDGLPQRLGWLPPLPLRPGSIWVHGVSVGEILAARHLIHRLGEVFPDRQVVVSTTTSTGQAVARQAYPEHSVFYYPLDLTPVLRRVLTRVRPAILVLLELEVWPNMLRLAESQGLPVVVVNGRLSARSYRFYGRFGRLRFGFLNRVTHYGVQDSTVAGRMLDLGIAPERITVTGSLKYDTVQTRCPLDGLAREKLRRRLGLELGQPVLVLGSTHPSEAGLLAPVVARLRGTHPELGIVWVPRHPERHGAVGEALRAAGLPPVRLTQVDSGRERPIRGAVVIGDTIGELASFYSVATMVFVGKSLGTEHGGQNLLEPAALGKPVAVGPHTGNFAREVDYLRRQGGVAVVERPAELERVLRGWLEEPAAGTAVGQAARLAIEGLRGGSEAAVGIIRVALQAASGSPSAPR